MTTEIRTRTIAYTALIQVPGDPASGTPPSTREETRFRVETYVVDIPDAPPPAGDDTVLPANARLLSIEEYEDTDGDGAFDAGADVQLGTETYDDEILAGADGGFTDSVALGAVAREDGVRIDAIGDEALDLATLEAEMPGQVLGPDAAAFWNELPIDQQRQLVAVAAVASADGDAALARMMASPDGQARLLDGATSQGDITVLASLADVATLDLMGATTDAPTRTDLDTVREDLVDQMLRTIENPLLITQGNANSCTMASAQVGLAIGRPAEYARILRDLVVGGSATLAGGRTVSLPVDSVPNENPNRRQDDYLFQSALMQEVVRIDTGNPSATYNPATNDAYDPARGGQVEMYGQIFGGSAIEWPPADISAAVLDLENQGMVLAVYPPSGMGHAVAVLGSWTDPVTGEEFIEVRNTLPAGTPSALGQPGAAEGDVTRIPLASLTDGTYSLVILNSTGFTY